MSGTSAEPWSSHAGHPCKAASGCVQPDTQIGHSHMTICPPSCANVCWSPLEKLQTIQGACKSWSHIRQSEVFQALCPWPLTYQSLQASCESFPGPTGYSQAWHQGEGSAWYAMLLMLPSIEWPGIGLLGLSCEPSSRYFSGRWAEKAHQIPLPQKAKVFWLHQQPTLLGTSVVVRGEVLGEFFARSIPPAWNQPRFAWTCRAWLHTCTPLAQCKQAHFHRNLHPTAPCCSQEWTHQTWP